MLRKVPATLVLTLTALLVERGARARPRRRRGLYGETSDIIVTNAGFILIIFFPLFILLMSLLQWQLEKRKYRRKAAAKAADRGRGRLVAPTPAAAPARRGR